MEIERKSDEIGSRKEEKAREETRRRNDELKEGRMCKDARDEIEKQREMRLDLKR